MKKQLRGFARMSPALRTEYAAKGGLATSSNRKHMSDIGKKGGLKVSADKAHMAKISSLGVITRRDAFRFRMQADHE